MNQKNFYVLCFLLLALGWVGAAVTEPAFDVEAKATSIGLDDLCSQAQVICWAKHIGAGRMVPSNVIKGDVSEEFTVPTSHASILPKGQTFLLFIADRATWSLVPDGAFVVRGTKGYDRVVLGRLNPTDLLINMDGAIKLALHNFPAGREHEGKAIMPRSLGSLVDEVVARGTNPPRIRLDEFETILTGVLKAQNFMDEGQAIPDMVNQAPLGPDPNMPKLVDFTPRQIRPPHGARKMTRQFCTGTPVPGMGDEVCINVPFTTFSFPYNGTTYTSVYVSDNGFITFGATYFDYSPNIYQMFNVTPPSIYPYWEDFDPSSGGTVTYQEVSATEFVICWEVPSYGAADTNSFAVHLYSNGDYMFEYDWLDNLDGVMGASPGGAAETIPGDWDLSTEDGNILGTGYESHWYDIYSNDFYYIDGMSISFVGNPTGVGAIDQYEPNDNQFQAHGVPDLGAMGNFGTLDGCDMFPGDTDWFEINMPVGGLYNVHAYAWSWNLQDLNFVDPVLGLFDADGNLIAMDDDSGPEGDSDLSIFLPGGRYYFAVSCYPDSGFLGYHSQTGTYAFNVMYYDSTGMPLPASDDGFIPVVLPFPFQFVNPWNMIYVGMNGNLTMLAGSTDYSEDQASLESGPPRIAAWWDDLDARDAVYPFGVYVLPFSNAVVVYWYGVPDYAGTYIINSAAILYDDGSFEIMNDLTTMDGLTGYGLGVGYPGGPTNLADEVQYNSVPDELTGGPIIGTGWELYMYQIFTAGPITVPEFVYYMGCYPYEYMTYDYYADTYIYMRYPDRFRIMSRDATSGHYLSDMYDPFCMYTPGDNIIHFIVGAVMEDFHARGWFSVDYSWGYGAAVGHNHGVPWECMGY